MVLMAYEIIWSVLTFIFHNVAQNKTFFLTIIIPSLFKITISMGKTCGFYILLEEIHKNTL
jgi:hypothetical protein